MPKSGITLRNSFAPILGAAVRIGWSKNGIAILRAGGWRRPASILLDHPAALTPEQLLPPCITALAATRSVGLPLAVTLSDQWARLFMVTPPHNSGRLQDLQAAASMRFQTLYGEAPGAWQLQADWDAQRPFLVCALPRSLLAALEQVAHESGLYLSSVTPHFIRAWNRWCRQVKSGAWFGVVQEDVLTLAAIPAKGPRHLCALHTVAIPADGHDPQWLREQLARAALRLTMPAPQQVQLTGNQRSYWMTEGATEQVAVNLEKTDTPITPQPTAAVLLARSGMHA